MILSDHRHDRKTGDQSLTHDGEPATVYLIDGDGSVLQAMSRLINAAGLLPVTFCSEDDFFNSQLTSRHACVVADLSMSGVAGLGLPKKLSKRGFKLPVIFLTALDNEAVRERAHRSGAAAYFRKPVDDQALIDSIRWALSSGVNKE